MQKTACMTDVQNSTVGFENLCAPGAVNMHYFLLNLFSPCAGHAEVFILIESDLAGSITDLPSFWLCTSNSK